MVLRTTLGNWVSDQTLFRGQLWKWEDSSPSWERGKPMFQL